MKPLAIVFHEFVATPVLIHNGSTDRSASLHWFSYIPRAFDNGVSVYWLQEKTEKDEQW